MTPSARVAAAIALLDRVEADLGAAPAGPPMLDRSLADWARANRYAGAKDRAAIADLVHDALRRRASSTFLLGEAAASPGRALALGALLAGEPDPEAALEVWFAPAPHAPAAPTPAERRRIAALAEPAARAAALADAPPWVRADWPEPLWDALAASVADPEGEARAETVRAAFDLRVNTLKAAPEAAAARLAAEGLETDPAPLSPIGLRARSRPRLGGVAAYLEGWIEPQDAASQATALLAAAATPAGCDGPIVDLCAGAGGKTLALAAAAPERRLFAHDVDPRRLEPARARLARAGASAQLLAPSDLAGLRGRAALVLVDAPCSGSGAWARSPEAKWRCSPAALGRYAAQQAAALAAAFDLCAPGGVVAYATCSLFRAENEASADAAERAAAGVGLARLEIGPLWRRAGLLGAPPAADATRLRLSPARHGTEGFFFAAWARAPR